MCTPQVVPCFGWGCLRVSRRAPLLYTAMPDLNQHSPQRSVHEAEMSLLSPQPTSLPAPIQLLLKIFLARGRNSSRKEMPKCNNKETYPRDASRIPQESCCPFGLFRLAQRVAELDTISALDLMQIRSSSAKEGPSLAQFLPSHTSRPAFSRGNWTWQQMCSFYRTLFSSWN